MLVPFFHAHWKDPFYVMKLQGRNMVLHQVLGERLGKSDSKGSEGDSRKE